MNLGVKSNLVRNIHLNIKCAMPKITLLIFLVFICAPSFTFSQTRPEIFFDYNAFSKKDSISDNLAFDQLINKVEFLSEADVQRICLIAGWIFDNIDFDLTKFDRGGAISNYEIVFRTRKGLCGDYASLFSEFCNRFNISNEIIEGYVPELDSEKIIYRETNHAWNIVKLGENWYHCDLLGFSGKLIKENNQLRFIKLINPENLLTQDRHFIAGHIPADPMWQLNKFPVSLNSLIEGVENSEKEYGLIPFSYIDSINAFLTLPLIERSLKFAKNAHNYNRNNHNVVIINYYNAAVSYLNSNPNNSDYTKAKACLLKALNFTNSACNTFQILKPEIERTLRYVDQYLNKMSVEY